MGVERNRHRRHPRRHFHCARAAPGEADARRQSADLLCRARRTGRDRPAGLLAAGGRRKRHPDHGRRAVACALELDQCAQAFVAEQAAQGVDFGATRIGVHTGMAVVGNFGGEARFDYTAHGDTINIAARLEGANKHLGTLICISGATVEQCGDRDFRPVGSLVLKGKTEAVEVFEAIPEELVASPKTAEYSRAFELLKNGRPEARAAFSALAEKYPDDGLIRFHAKRLIAGEATSLIVMEEK
ncbi:MAG: adenylate/guanylate cyclase domain-containing protein [Proteobacteria bacterium]|nr:adenylate/guanylate cyclase domain-containing protein [Pseudomonadota bacterium]